MTNLLKSIRHEMNQYGPRLRSGHYGVIGYTLGAVPIDFSYLCGVYCDVESGIVTDVRLYTVGDATSFHDAYGDSIDITDPVKEYLCNNLTWAEMLSAIEAIVKEYAE